VGSVFQHAAQQLFARTLREDVSFGPRALGFPAPEVRRRTDEALDALDLHAHAAQHPYDLSPALRKLAALAGALALEPTVLVLDEPTAGLDRAGRGRVADAVREHADRGAALLVVTHDLAFAAETLQRRIVLDRGRLACDEPLDRLRTSAERLDLHGVGTIALPQNPAPAQLFDLLRVLAEQPGLEDFAARLSGSGAAGIRVTSAGEAPPRPPQDGVGPVAPVIPSPDAARPAVPTLGTDGILRGEAMRDIRSVQLSGVPMVTHDPPPPPAARALPGEQAAHSDEPTFSPSHAPTPQTPSTAPAPPAASTAGRSAAAPRAAAPSRQPPAGAAGVLGELERDPAGVNVGDLLATVIEQAESALKRNRLEEVLRLVAGIARIEERLPEASGARRQYGIALRRICTKPVVEAIARLVGAPKHRAEATLALRRAGADAVEVLLGMLVAAPGMSERRAAFDALTQMTQGTEQ